MEVKGKTPKSWLDDSDDDVLVTHGLLAEDDITQFYLLFIQHSTLISDTTGQYVSVQPNRVLVLNSCC